MELQQDWYKVRHVLSGIIIFIFIILFCVLHPGEERTRNGWNSVDKCTDV